MIVNEDSKARPGSAPLFDISATDDSVAETHCGTSKHPGSATHFSSPHEAPPVAPKKSCPRIQPIESTSDFGSTHALIGYPRGIK